MNSMAIEIERKFLVTGAYKQEATGELRITQGYLNSAPERTVRVRLRNGQGWITVKGKGNDSGTSRYEWEKEIPADEARELLRLCEPGVIDKTRYLIPVGEYTYEVDEFYGDNEGLTMAEIELPDESAPFERPAWLGREVTGDRRFYNAQLSKNPYKNWREEYERER